LDSSADNAIGTISHNFFTIFLLYPARGNSADRKRLMGFSPKKLSVQVALHEGMLFPAMN
jgi:hypothetical protein